jgi:hypothetical protein
MIRTIFWLAFIIVGTFLLPLWWTTIGFLVGLTIEKAVLGVEVAPPKGADSSN